MFNLGLIHKALYKRLIAANIETYDNVEKNNPLPFTFIQFISSREEANKVAEIKEVIYYVHAVTGGDTALTIYNYIEDVQEALREDIKLEECYSLVNTSSNVLQVLTEEDGGKHAVIEYKFKVIYKKRG